MPPSDMVALAKSREDDSAVIEKWSTGSPESWRDVFSKYHASMMATARDILRNEQDAEEIVHDSFRAAYRNLANFRGDCSLSTWLHTITRRQSLNRYAYWKRRKRAESQSLDAPITEDGKTLADCMIDGGADPRAHLKLSEDIRSIARIIQDGLSQSDRELVLDRARGMTYEELGEKYRIKFGTVKSRLARARASVIAALRNGGTE